MENKIETVCTHCKKKSRVPVNKGKIKITCPHCDNQWYWDPNIESEKTFTEQKQGINLLILGKTGVGKSSFCNYIFGVDDFFTVGKGKRGTEWNDHFRFHSLKYAKHTLNIFDSVGIEADNLDEWDRRLKKLLNERNKNIDSSPMDWIHGVLYLINANSARVEVTELDIIKKLMTNNIPVHIILTNVDVAKGKEEDLRNTLMKELKPVSKSSDIDNLINIHDVCSVSIKTRGGVSEPTGKDAVLQSFLSELDKKLRMQILSHFIDKMGHVISNAQQNMKNEISKKDIGIITKITAAWDDNLANEFSLNDKFEKISKNYQLYVTVLDEFIESLGYRSTSTVMREIEEINLTLDKMLQKAKKDLKIKITNLSFLNSIFNLNEKIHTMIDESLNPIELFIYNKKRENNPMTVEYTPVVGKIIGGLFPGFN